MRSQPRGPRDRNEDEDRENGERNIVDDRDEGSFEIFGAEEDGPDYRGVAWPRGRPLNQQLEDLRRSLVLRMQDPIWVV